ncbi:hypothetical protein H0B56_03110 [Haloechinothrix sp. YIM 98757]|uniref:Lipoprotein n=1 Tax=Haloechinothrix aidingensis TaxID=2752311 RepID=A0A838A0B7_9PSEU|nr:LppA family lipoprotein [Haloechinothrix aidingensis]MBA0124523.1 hypothetical protein [Haloechinothrix aidingensis]
MNSRTRARPLNTTAALTICALLLAGCAAGDPDDRSDMTLEEQYEQVAQRPDIDEAIKAYEQLHNKVQAELREKFDLPAWEKGTHEETRTPGCGDFPDLIGWDAESSSLQSWVSEASISLEDWSQAKAILRTFSQEHGFDKVSIDIAQSDNLAYELMNDTGAKITLRSGRGSNVLLGGATGCHLTPGAKERGRPISQEERREMDEEEREQYRE